MDLPDDLELPLRRGEGHWVWLGGRPALDLVNTLRERWRREVETLVTAGDLTAWLAEAGLLPAGTKARATRAQLVEALELREAIDAGLRAVIDEEPVPGATIRQLNAHLPSSQVGERLVAQPGGIPVLKPVPPRDAVAHALGLIAADAALLLGTEERRRGRICASPTCSARFYDRSPGGRRRWCTMRGCGNAAKARRHREREKASRA